MKVLFEGVEYAVGQVWRHQFIQPWGDHIILGFPSLVDDVKVARPYAYASECGSVLQGCEIYTLPLKHLKDWKLLGNTTLR